MLRRSTFPLTPLYEPLSHVFSFRLLELGPETFTAGIKAKLIPVAFGEDLPPYEALSYTWGERAVDCKITVHGHEVMIAQNCHDALKQLRRRSKPRMLWIDSICINQSSVAERNHQVRLMGEIYRNAKLVLVWLGEEDVWSKLAFRFLQRFKEFGKVANVGDMNYEQYLDGLKRILDETLHDERTTIEKLKVVTTRWKVKSKTEDFSPTKPRRVLTGEHEAAERSKSLPAQDSVPSKEWKQAMDVIETPLTPENERDKFEVSESPLGKAANEEVETQPDPNGHTRCQSVHELLKRPWFSRMWTIQEVALARDCLILCGKAFISWQDFVEAVSHLQAQPGFQDISTTMIGHVYSRARLNTVERELLSPTVRSEDMEGLLTLLNSCRSKDSTDPRDKVFALFGLLHAQKYNVFEPDYGRALEEVYVGMAEFVLRTENSLSLLLYATHTSTSSPREELNLPSWVPDWSDKSFDEFLLANSHDHYVATPDMWRLLGVKPRKYSADRDSRLRFSLSDKGRKLGVQGLGVDTVRYVQRFQFGGTQTESNLRAKIQAAAPKASPESLDLISTDWMVLIPFLRRCIQDTQLALTGGTSHPLVELCSALAGSCLSDEDLEKAFQEWRGCINPSEKKGFCIYPLDDTIPPYSDEYFLIRATLNVRGLGILHSSSEWESFMFTFLEPDTQIGLSILSNTHAQKFHLTLQNVLRGRNIFTTTRGRMGASPIDITAGNGVFILDSLDTPVVLKARETVGASKIAEYTFVGPTYLTGAMSGQLYSHGGGQEDVHIV